MNELPICAVCRTRVARLERVFSPAANRGLGGHSLIAHCHGQVEVVDISDADLLAMVPSSMHLGVAFQRDAAELDLRDRAFSAPRPYQASERFRYGAHHGDTPNGSAAPSLNGLVDFRRLPTR
jgi:hypothetical protein